MTATIQELPASKSATHDALPAHLQPGIPVDLTDLSLIDIKTGFALVGQKATSIYGNVAAGEFPEPVRMGVRCIHRPAFRVRVWLLFQSDARQDDGERRQQAHAEKANDAAHARYQAATQATA